MMQISAKFIASFFAGLNNHYLWFFAKKGYVIAHKLLKNNHYLWFFAGLFCVNVTSPWRNLWTNDQTVQVLQRSTGWRSASAGVPGGKGSPMEDDEPWITGWFILTSYEYGYEYYIHGD